MSMSASAVSTAHIEVRSPPNLLAREPLQDLVGDVITDLCGRGFDYDLVLTPSADGRFVVTVDDRPAVVIIDEQSAESLTWHLGDRLARRLALVRGDGDRTRGVSDYLVDLGFAPARGITPASRRPPFSKVVQEAEALMAHEPPRPMTVEVAQATLRRTTSSDPDLLVSLRQRIFQRSGVELPDLVIVPTDAPAGTVQVRFNDIALPAARLTCARWADVVAHLESVVEPRLHWLLHGSQVKDAFDELSFLAPDLIRAALQCYPIPVLTGCLRELLRSGISIRNLSRIAWQLLELGTGSPPKDTLLLTESPLLPAQGTSPRPLSDPIALASWVRGGFDDEEWRIGTTASGRPARLSQRAERDLLKADGPEAVAHAEWQVVEEVLAVGAADTIAVSAVSAIGRVDQAVQALPSPPGVAAWAEFPIDLRAGQLQEAQ
jgi:hypothetical protein